jgi:adenylate cyclase class IV
MHEEIEIKFLEVDVPTLEARLKNYGAERVGETLSRITNFDFPDYRLKAENAWVRLRTEFGKTTLTFKQRLGVQSHDTSIRDEGMKEIEITVSDFEITRKLLHAIGMIEKFSQERKRVHWQKVDLSFDIDTWPLIPPYFEIEGTSWESVEKAAGDLGFNYEEHLRCTAGNILKKYGYADHDYSVFTFDTQIKKDLAS